VIETDWTFAKAGLAESFDEYVRGQLPWYDLASGMVAHVARHYVPRGGLVYDLGASTGNVGRVIADVLAARSARLVAIETDEEMVNAYDAPGHIERGRVEAFEYEPFDFAVSFLTLMFVAPADRAPLLARLQAACRPGGSVMLVEKQDPPGGYVGTVMRRMTLAAKAATGVSPSDVVEKGLQLEVQSFGGAVLRRSACRRGTHWRRSYRP